MPGHRHACGKADFPRQDANGRPECLSLAVRPPAFYHLLNADRNRLAHYQEPYSPRANCRMIQGPTWSREREHIQRRLAVGWLLIKLSCQFPMSD